jgi:hypothetical protein
MRNPARVPKNRELTKREWFILQLVFFYSRTNVSKQKIGDGDWEINFKDSGFFIDELNDSFDNKFGEKYHYSQSYSPRVSKVLQNIYLKGYLERRKTGNFYGYYFTFTELHFYEKILLNKLLEE